MTVGGDALCEPGLSREHQKRLGGNCSTAMNLTYTVSESGTRENLTEYDNYYNYDYASADTSFPLGELVPVAVVYSLTLVLGVLGNALVIFSILRYKRMQNVTNIFLTSLASADLLLVTLCVPIKVRPDTQLVASACFKMQPNRF